MINLSPLRHTPQRGCFVLPRSSCKALCVLMLGLHRGNSGIVSSILLCLHSQWVSRRTLQKSHTGNTLLPPAENDRGEVDTWSPRSSLRCELPAAAAAAAAAAAELSRADRVLQQLIRILMTECLITMQSSGGSGLAEDARSLTLFPFGWDTLLLHGHEKFP